jgi:two-component system NarL family sensor kinase
MDNPSFIFVVVVGTAFVLSLIAIVGFLMFVNTNRRIRHRAEVAELRQQQDRAVMDAEREATRHTLRELGNELHDNVGQLLVVSQLGVNTVVDELGGHPRLAAARDALEQALDEVRRLGHDLNSELWEKRSLADAICAEAERLERVARVQVHIQVVNEAPMPNGDTSTVLYRVFQVILANAIKHSGADRIGIVLRPAEDARGLCLTVTDNGVGFDTASTPAHAGLVNIHKRCALIGYSAHCTTTPGSGCAWTLEPLPHHVP